MQRLSFYPDAVGRPIEQKVTVGGPEVLDRALETNLDYGQAIRPRNADADDPLLPELRALLRDLPPAVHRLASRYVLAVYVLQDDYGTGTTEGIQDDQGRWRYSYIALNRTALTRTANAWATWKENSAFRPQPGAALRVQIEPPESDTRAQAVQFILLHELGHAIGLGLGVHGFWDAETLPAVTRDSPFVALSWQVDADDALVSRYATRFPLLVRARFYRFDKAPLELSQAQDIYRDLSQTNLPSLYGITNLFDDWAESFAIYVHTRLLDKPYQVQVLQGDQVRATYQSCLQVGTCPEKMAYLESVLGTGQ
ncbi:MAG TPA: hypothetical protein VL359_05245 [bacterium]|nr:hypothetical protein [bacterium]